VKKVKIKSGTRIKHIPQRTCIGCKQVLPKRSLIRVVRTAEGIQIDLTGKLNGRGAYLHDRPSCWQAGLKGTLAHSLKVEISAQDMQTLSAFASTLKEEED
jgi:uncharacterized protein